MIWMPMLAGAALGALKGGPKGALLGGALGAGGGALLGAGAAGAGAAGAGAAGAGAVGAGAAGAGAAGAGATIPWWQSAWGPSAIGAGLGAMKSELIDRPAAEKEREYQAMKTEMSPWTGMQGQYVKDPSMLGGAIEGGITGLQMGQSAAQYENALKMQEAQKELMGKMGKLYEKGVDSGIMPPSSVASNLMAQTQPFDQGGVPFQTQRQAAGIPYQTQQPGQFGQQGIPYKPTLMGQNIMGNNQNPWMFNQNPWATMRG